MQNASAVDIDIVQTGVAGHHIGRLKVRRGKAHVAPVVVVVGQVAYATSDEDVASLNEALFQVVVDAVATLFQTGLAAITQQSLTPEPLHVLKHNITSSAA